jgi:hypothetical protein
MNWRAPGGVASGDVVRCGVPTNANQTNIQPANEVYTSIQGGDLASVSDDISKTVADLQKQPGVPGKSVGSGVPANPRLSVWFFSHCYPTRACLRLAAPVTTSFRRAFLFRACVR